MTAKQYYSLTEPLFTQLKFCASRKFILTARARIRDIARLRFEYDGTPIKATIAQLTAEYLHFSAE